MIELWIPVLALLLALLPYLAVDQAIRLMARRQRRESARTLERMVRQGDLPEAVPPAESATILNRDGEPSCRPAAIRGTGTPPGHLYPWPQC